MTSLPSLPFRMQVRRLYPRMRQSRGWLITSPSRSVIPLLVFALIAIAAPDALLADPPAREPLDHDQFLVIPLRVHILSARDLPEIDCHLSDGDVTRMLKKVNQIWHNAGIHWGLESLVRESAALPERFLRARDLDSGDNLGVYRIVFPDASRRGAFVNIYHIHEFSVDGVWLGREAIVKETAKLREVEGGTDEPIPRVSAHEPGHALGLLHREDRTNLLASGMNGMLLNAAEVKAARERARGMSGAMSVVQVSAQPATAESAGDRFLACQLWEWLAEISGSCADAAPSTSTASTPEGQKCQQSCFHAPVNDDPFSHAGQKARYRS
jgi:hypothetical protein